MMEKAEVASGPPAANQAMKGRLLLGTSERGQNIINILDVSPKKHSGL